MKNILKNKKFYIILASIVIAIIGTISIILLYNSINTKGFSINESNVFEINSYIENEDLVKDLGDYKITNIENIDTSKLGKFKYVLSLTDKDNKIVNKKITYIVNDTLKPVIEGETNIVLEKGAKFIPSDYVTVKDNSLEELNIEVKGDYDTNKVGKYELMFVSQDSSGNKTEVKFSLEIKDKIDNEENKTNNTNNSQAKPNNSNNTSNKNNTNNSTNNKYQNSSEFYDYVNESMNQRLSRVTASYDGKVWTSNPGSEIHPENGVTIYIQRSVFHYEWSPVNARWNIVEESGPNINGTKEANEIRRLVPPPNREGNMISYEENGITYEKGEVTNSYTVYITGDIKNEQTSADEEYAYKKMN